MYLRPSGRIFGATRPYRHRTRNILSYNGRGGDKNQWTPPPNTRRPFQPILRSEFTGNSSPSWVHTHDNSLLEIYPSAWYHVSTIQPLKGRLNKNAYCGRETSSYTGSDARSYTAAVEKNRKTKYHQFYGYRKMVSRTQQWPSGRQANNSAQWKSGLISSH